MSEWDRRKLEELAAPGKNAMATGPFGSAISSRFFRDEGVPVIRGSNLSLDVGKRLIDDDIVFVDQEKAEQFTRSIAGRGDLVFTCWGTIGQVGFIDENSRFEQYIVSNKQMKLTPDHSRVDPLFLYYALSSPAHVAQVQGLSIGSSVPGFNLTQLRQVEVLCPTLPEQQAIAALLGTLDDKITVNERIAAVYEQLLQCRYTELGLSDEPDDQSGIPITNLISFNPKVAKPSAEEPVYVDMAVLRTDRAGIAAWNRRAPKSGPRFMNGDTLLARITPCLENGKTGYVDFMEDNEVGLGSTEFIVMRSRVGVPSELSYFLARDARFREHAVRTMSGTSGRQRVSASDASNYFVRQPDPDALVAFGEQAAAAFAHMKSLRSESRTLASLRDTLLPQLMSGRLRVRDAEKIAEDHA